MDNKKISALFILSLISTFMFVNFASAQYFRGSSLGYTVENVINSIVSVATPILSALFGGTFWDGYLLFEKLLLFIIVAVVSYLALSNVPVFKDQNKKLVKLIAVIVALIGIRNLDYLWLGTIFVQYQVLFVAVAGVLPFIIYWYFLKDMEGIPRKIGWILYAVIYFGLWITNPIDAHESVYLWTALAALVYAFFFDVMVHNWMERQSMRKGNRYQIGAQIANISAEIETIQKNLNNNHYRSPGNEALARERIKILEKRIRQLQRGGY